MLIFRCDVSNRRRDLRGCFFQAEDGIRDLVRSRGLGDVYKRQVEGLQIDLRRCGRLPQAQRADALRAMAGNHHVVGLSLIHI